jgi:hypothetical protein
MHSSIVMTSSAVAAGDSAAAFGGLAKGAFSGSLINGKPSKSIRDILAGAPGTAAICWGRPFAFFAQAPKRERHPGKFRIDAAARECTGHMS